MITQRETAENFSFFGREALQRGYAVLKKSPDYYPFGQVLPNRNGNTPEYRYGFQGQLKDDELKGANNSLNFEYRMHDPRIGRFFAVDPLASQYPYNSPYAFSENVVINAVELEGLEKVHVYNVWYDGKGNKHYKKSHIEIDNSLTVNKRVYRYFDEHGKVAKTRSEVIQESAWVSTIPTTPSSSGKPVGTAATGSCFLGAPTLGGTPSNTNSDAPEGYKTVPGTKTEVYATEYSTTKELGLLLVFQAGNDITGVGVIDDVLIPFTSCGIAVSVVIETFVPKLQHTTEEIVPIDPKGVEILEAKSKPGQNSERQEEVVHGTPVELTPRGGGARGDKHTNPRAGRRSTKNRGQKGWVDRKSGNVAN